MAEGDRQLTDERIRASHPRMGKNFRAMANPHVNAITVALPPAIRPNRPPHPIYDRGGRFRGGAHPDGESAWIDRLGDTCRCLVGGCRRAHVGLGARLLLVRSGARTRGDRTPRVWRLVLPRTARRAGRITTIGGAFNARSIG